MSDLQDALDHWDRARTFDEMVDMTPIVTAARLVADAIPVVCMGGLSPAYYVTDDPTEADAWLITKATE